MNSNEKSVAIVTGASDGIGLGITLALLDHGYRVVGTSRGHVRAVYGIQSLPMSPPVLIDAVFEID